MESFKWNLLLRQFIQLLRQMKPQILPRIVMRKKNEIQDQMSCEEKKIKLNFCSTKVLRNFHYKTNRKLIESFVVKTWTIIA